MHPRWTAFSPPRPASANLSIVWIRWLAKRIEKSLPATVFGRMGESKTQILLQLRTLGVLQRFSHRRA
jgi:hypothetical protein